MQNIINKNTRRVLGDLNAFPFENKEKYANFLVQTWHYVRHSTRMLALAASRIDVDNKNDFNRFAVHIQEEADHDVLAHDDLNLLGYDIDCFSQLEETKMLWETQFYKIEHESPMALMGYIIMLESIASIGGGAISDRIVKTHGDKTNSFIKEHGVEDIKHIKEAIALTERQPDKIIDIIIRNNTQSSVAYSNMLESIKKSSMQ